MAQPAALQWYRRYALDFYTSESVMTMSLAAIGAYNMLLDYQWVKGSLPSETKALAAIVRVSEAEFLPLWTEHLESLFSMGEDGRLRNMRLEEERTELDRERKEFAAKQKSRSEKRWGKGSDDHACGTPEESGNITGHPRDNHGNATDIPRVSHGNTTGLPRDTGVIPNRELELEKEIQAIHTPNAGVGACDQTKLDPPEPKWWEVCEDALCRDVAVGIRASKGFEKDEPDARKVEELVRRTREFAPDDDAVRAIVEEFQEFCQSKRNRPYTDPLKALKNWIDRRESVFRQTKRQREIDASRLQKQPTQTSKRDVVREALNGLGVGS